MIRFDYNYFMKENIGSEHGISQEEIDSIKAKSDDALKRMDREKGEGALGFLEIPFDEDIIKRVKEYRSSIGDRFRTIAIIGIGGSALGPQALKNSLSHLYLNELSEEDRDGRYKVYFFDNVDPYEIIYMKDILNFKKTLFIVISKSGGTTETNANFAILKEFLKEDVGSKYQDHIVAITDPEKGILRKISIEEGFMTFPIPSNVGGRFSILSSVGLVMAEFIGIDIKRLMQGARNAISQFYGKQLQDNIPLLNATFHYLFDQRKSKRINVLIPYTRKLYLFADWYRQLWAESLGKNRDINDNIVEVGLTPIPALGTIDQHSQLQLYLEGPNDKVFTFLKIEDFEIDVTIPEFYKGMPEVDYLSHKSLRELNRFEESATELVLKETSRPNASLILPKLQAEEIGELIMILEMQTSYAGYLYNINPFNQPAVEQGKRITWGLLKRPGYEDIEDQFKKRFIKSDKYIL
ncbi:MAG: glucose-6-phosphate isomerase [Spirochaetota bacterium]|nr:glucose-6-phosphate isomerase [Spirochaetota bacterium]